MSKIDFASSTTAPFTVTDKGALQYRLMGRYLRSVLVEARLESGDSLFVLAVYPNSPAAHRAVDVIKTASSKSGLDEAFSFATCCLAETTAGGMTTRVIHGSRVALPLGLLNKTIFGHRVPGTVLPRKLDKASWLELAKVDDVPEAIVKEARNIVKEKAVPIAVQPRPGKVTKAETQATKKTSKTTAKPVPKASTDAQSLVSREKVPGDVDHRTRAEYRRKSYAVGHRGYAIGLPGGMEEASPLIRQIDELYSEMKKQGKLLASEKQVSFMFCIRRATGIAFGFDAENATQSQASEYISRATPAYQALKKTKAGP